jgi:hypothetical protein
MTNVVHVNRWNGLNTLGGRWKRATLLQTPFNQGKTINLACFQCIH